MMSRVSTRQFWIWGICICLVLDVSRAMSSQAEINKLIENARNTIGVGGSILMKLEEMDREDPFYVEITMQCLLSDENRIYGNGLSLYASYLRVVPYERENAELRATFLASMDRMDEVSAPGVISVINAMTQITEDEFMGIVEDADAAVARHWSNPEGHGTQVAPIYAYAVAGLHGDPLDTFLDIVSKRRELQARLQNGVQAWIRLLEDLRASRLILEQMMAMDQDALRRRGVDYLSLRSITDNLTKRSQKGLLAKPGDRDLLKDYFQFLTKVSGMEGMTGRLFALEEMLILGEEFPELAAPAMAVATERVDDWKATPRAQNIEKCLGSVTKRVELLEKAKTNPEAKAEFERLRRERIEHLESIERIRPR